MADVQPLPTQDLIDVASIEDDVVVLKNGALRQILIVSGVNFELKSEEEQDIILYAYQNLLNSLDFSIQFVVHSRKLNIESYLKTLEELISKEEDELLREQIREYQIFISDFVSQNTIMTKTFFVVVPYERIVLPTKSKLPFSLPFVQQTTKKEPENSTAEELAKDIQQLRQRTEQVIIGLQNIGLRAVPLNREEIIELLYNLYNPETIEKKDIPIAKGYDDDKR
jgi:type IV secretory pathway VirB4 component